MSWSKLIDSCILLAVVLGATITAILSSNYLHYHAGVNNAPSGFDSQVFMIWVALLIVAPVLALATLVAGIIRFRRWRPLTRILWLILLLVPVATAIIGNRAVNGRTGAAQYDRGFQHWAATAIDPTAVRAWLGTQPPLPPPPRLVAQMSPADWPLALAKLRPNDISRGPTGVFLTFGTFGTWGDQRQVFIAADPAAADPGIYSRGGDWHPLPSTTPADSPWIKIAPGVYYWIQSGG